MNKEFVPYEEALAMKELGFDEPCFGWFQPEVGYIEVQVSWSSEQPHRNSTFQKNNSIGLTIAAPLFQQAFRWFREKYGLYGHLESSPEEKWFYVIEDISKATGYTRKDGTERQMPRQLVVCDNLPSYEEAQLACLRELIKIVKDEQTRRVQENLD